MAGTTFSIGLEFDHLAVRSARVAKDSKGGYSVANLVDLTGDFSDDAALIEGIRQVVGQLKVGTREPLAACLLGKQISASQITFRRLPREEMESALRLEVRKSLPFEIAGASLDYHILTPETVESETIQVLVAVAGTGLLKRHLQVLEKAGLAPQWVDVLPVAIANSLWSWVGTPRGEKPLVALHIGPQISTIVVDGIKTPFFNRSVYFAAEDFANGNLTPDLEKSLLALSDEVLRSLAFYEKSNFTTGFQEINLLGEYLDTPTLKERLSRQTGLPVKKMDLPKKFGMSHDKPQGRFDLAVNLAVKAAEA